MAGTATGSTGMLLGTVLTAGFDTVGLGLTVGGRAFAGGNSAGATATFAKFESVN